MNKFVLLLCCIVFSSLSAFAQQLPEPELSETIAKIDENSREEVIAAGAKIYNHYTSKRMVDSVFYYTRKVVEIGEKLNAPEIYFAGSVNIAGIFMSKGEPDSSFSYLDLVLEGTKNLEGKAIAMSRAKAFMYYGAMYQEYNLGEEKAFSFFREAIELSKKNKDTKVFIRCSRGLALNYFHKKEYDKGLKIITACYDYLDGLEVENEKYTHIINRVKAGYLYERGTTEAERKEALDLVMNAYKYYERKGEGVAKALSFMALITRYSDELSKEELLALIENNYADAERFFLGSRRGGVLAAYGKVLTQFEDYDKAIPLLVEAKEILKETPHMSNYLGVSELLIEVYDRTGQHEKILSEFKDYKIFQDSFIATVYSDKLLDLEEKYESEKKEKENVQLMSENNMIQTRLRLSLIIGILLLGFLAASVYFFLKMRNNKRELEKLNETKGKLFAILAHDLRNPIYSLSDLSTKVKYLSATNNLSELDEFTKRTNAKLNALNDNLNNILLWGITESNLVEVKPEEVSLQEEIDKINELYSNAIEQKKIIIKNQIADSSSVHIDVKVFQTIARNLISNAIKFSYPGGTIEVLTKKEKKYLELRIKDKGIGLREAIEEESVDQKTIREESKGSGIGLKICKELAVKSGLKLDLVPNPDGGTIGIIRFKKAS